MTRSNLPRWNMLETSLLRDHDDIDFFSRNELLNPQFQLDILYRKGTAFNSSLRSGCYLRRLINFGIRMNAKRPSHPCAGGGASPGVRPRGERNTFPCIQMQRFCADTCPPAFQSVSLFLPFSSPVTSIAAFAEKRKPCGSNPATKKQRGAR